MAENKWVTEVVTLLMGVVTPLVTGSGAHFVGIFAIHQFIISAAMSLDQCAGVPQMDFYGTQFSGSSTKTSPLIGFPSLNPLKGVPICFPGFLPSFLASITTWMSSMLLSASLCYK